MNFVINRNIYINFYFLLIIGILTLFYYLIPFNVSNSDTQKLIILSNIIVIVDVLILFISDKKQIDKLGLFRAIYIFTLSYCIVHFQESINYVIYSTPFSTRSTLTNSVIIKSLIIGDLGLTSYIFGFFLFRIKHLKHKSYLKYNSYALLISNISIAILLVLFLYFGQGYLFMFAYGSVDMLGSSYSYVELLFEIAVYTNLIINIVKFQQNCKRAGYRHFFKSVGVIANVSIFIFIVAILTSGDRGPAIYMLLAYLFSAQIATKKKISLKKGIVIGLTGAFGISAWGLIRSANSTVNSLSDIYSSLYQDESKQSISPTTDELAGSVRALHYAVMTVPSEISYQNMTFQCAYILHSIPFTSFMDPYLFPNKRFLQSTSFITWIEQGDNPWSGVGTACTADAYVDMGIIGMTILMFVFGIILRISDVILETDIKDLSLFVISLVFTVNVLAVYFPRSSILFHLKNVLWLWVFLKLFIRRVRRA